MAIDNPATTTRRNAKLGQRLLVDTARMSVRRVSRNESSILAALKSLAPSERATLATLADTLQAKKRKRASVEENDHV